MRTFPVLGGSQAFPGAPKLVPWELLEPHREQAFLNHGQTLERLAERGGLSPDEIMSIISDSKYHTYWEGMTSKQKIVESVKRLNDVLSK